MQGRKQRDEMLAKHLLRRVWVDQADKAGVGRERSKGTLDCAACGSRKQQTDRQTGRLTNACGERVQKLDGFD